MATITHAKTNNIADWTQADLDAQIALGNYPPGTTLADITLPSDWNDDHALVLGADEHFMTDAEQTKLAGLTQYTDEMAQDAVGNILTDSSTVDFTYNDGANTITAAVIANSSTQKVEVVKNSGAVVGTRKQLNFIEGSNVTLTIADDSGNDQVDITIAAAGGSGSPGGSNTQIQFNNAGSFGGAAALTYASSGTHLTATAQAATDKAVIVKGATSQTANLFEAQNSSGTAFLTIGAPTLAGDSATKNFINLTATMPTTMTAATYASRYDITTAGSSSFAVVGHLSTLVAGYTGSSTTIVGQFINNTSGTGATYAASSGSTDYRIASANYALAPSVSNTTTGTNVTVRALCNGSSTVNYAAWNSASSSNNTPALNVGTASFALNATTNCAGFFALADYGTSAPTFSNAALIADNGATTGDIFVARDNGTAVFTIANGGAITSTGDISVPDEAYGPSWNGSTEVPTKNALYDKIETISGGGGSPAFTLVEKDLGANPRRDGKFTITGLSGLSVGKPVSISQAVGPYTNKGTLADEAEMDGLIVKAIVTAADTITAYWNSATRVRGNFKFNYFIGA